MAQEEFPRFRERNFIYQGEFKLPYYRGGRLDFECADRYGVPTTYKVFAAANRIMNPMLTRPGIRPVDESIRNELVLRGYTGARLEAELRRITEESIRGVRDWLGWLGSQKLVPTLWWHSRCRNHKIRKPMGTS